MADLPPGSAPQQKLGMQLYVIITKPVVPPEKIATKIQDHLKHQIEIERQGILFGAGPLFEDGAESPHAGMIVVRANSFAEADKIAQGDPFHSSGFREYTITRWSLNEGSINLKIDYSDQTVKVS